MITVAVGSTNPTKVEATRKALRRVWPDLVVVAVEVPTGVSEQPIGIAEMRRGAKRRAQEALSLTKSDWGVGLEGGVVWDAHGVGWLTGVALLASHEEQQLWSVGPCLPLPSLITNRIRQGEELGPIVDSLTGTADAKRGQGAIGWLTGNLVSREQSWIVTVACAVAPLLHPDLYR